MMRVFVLGYFLLVACSTAFGEIEDSKDDDKSSSPQVVFSPPSIPDDSLLALYFQSSADKEKFISSSAMKDGVEADLAKYDGKWDVEVPAESAVLQDFGLILRSEGKHYGVSTRLSHEYKFDSPEFVVQYEVKFSDGLTCGGAYIKLLSASPSLDLDKLTDKTPYTIMFGPDKCGQTSKVHFIFRHKSPITGAIEEKHAAQTTQSLDSYFSDKKTHLFTLVIRNDNTFEIFVDQSLIKSGSLLEDVIPAVNPPKEISDPNDTKPADWDDRPKVVDTTATKPADWDEDAPAKIIDENAVMPTGWLEHEPLMINDPEAEQPKDWDADTDGEWEPPKIDNPVCKGAPGCGPWSKPEIPNPEYKGKWSAPLIDNPAYKGIWKPRMINNPDYFEDKEPYKMTPISALSLEIWTMSSQIVFDNFYIGKSKTGADSFAEQTWKIKASAEKAADTSAKSVVDVVRETFAEKPWLIAVIITGVLLPIGIIIYCCCRTETVDDSLPAQYKKTDAVVPDDHVQETVEDEEEDKEEEEEEENQKNESEESESQADASHKKGVADEEKDEEEKEHEEEEEEKEKMEDKEAAKKPATRRRTRKE